MILNKEILPLVHSVVKVSRNAVSIKDLVPEPRPDKRFAEEIVLISDGFSTERTHRPPLNNVKMAP